MRLHKQKLSELKLEEMVKQQQEQCRIFPDCTGCGYTAICDAKLSDIDWGQTIVIATEEDGTKS